MEAKRTCNGCEYQHHRFLCEEKYRRKYGEPCMSVDSIHVILNTKKKQGDAPVEKKKEYIQLTIFD